MQVGEATGVLHNFIVEPFIPHAQNEEGYICIYSKRDHDAILFTTEGGIDIGNVEDKAKILTIPVGQEDSVNVTKVTETLLGDLEKSKHERVGSRPEPADAGQCRPGPTAKGLNLPIGSDQVQVIQATEVPSHPQRCT